METISRTWAQLNCEMLSLSPSNQPGVWQKMCISQDLLTDRNRETSNNLLLAMEVDSERVVNIIFHLKKTMNA